MRKSDLSIGMKVSDSWYDMLGVGYVKEILKTRVKIQFTCGDRHLSRYGFGSTSNGIVTYDNAHVRFLRKES